MGSCEILSGALRDVPVTGHRRVGRAQRLCIAGWLGLLVTAGWAVPTPAETLRLDPMETKDSLERAWYAPAPSLDVRVARTRSAALEVGVWNLDGAARALVGDAFPEPAIERSRAALALAPDLPLAHLAHAQAHWQAHRPLPATAALVSSVLAIPRHPEAAPWFAGNALVLLAAALVSGAGVCLLLAAAWALPHMSHDLGDWIPRRNLPEFARAAVLASLLLVPIALGEGVFGLVLAAAVVAAWGYRGRRRWAVITAAGLLWVGLFPVLGLGTRVLTGLQTDAVARAALASLRGVGSPMDLPLLESAAQVDPLAGWALARRSVRRGELADAHALYERLLAQRPNDPALMNDAANVHLERGHLEPALALYRRAADLSDSAVPRFNLAQTHGRAFDVESLANALAEAQEVDAALVAELSQLPGARIDGIVAGLPVPREWIWERALASGQGEALASALRAPWVPGVLGRGSSTSALGLVLALSAGGLLARGMPRSSGCSQCGRRICGRCDPSQNGFVGSSCSDCARLFQRSEASGRSRARAQRIRALATRRRRLAGLAWTASLALPGAAGFLAGRPLLGLLGALSFGLAASMAAFPTGIVPDPLLMGDAARWAALGVAALSILTYGAVVTWSIRLWGGR
ncbi:tetratricopeptide repeat protein [Myxococcota bacterium]|nr:tetratricopeptide repeat protein [Myxococcota bacterium]